MTESASVLNSGAHSFRRLGSQKLPRPFNFPVSRARPEKIVWFLLAATSNHVQLRLQILRQQRLQRSSRRTKSKGCARDLRAQDLASRDWKFCLGGPAGRLAGVGFLFLLINSQTTKNRIEFITCEIVALSVASRPKKNAPLAKKLLRSTL